MCASTSWNQAKGSILFSSHELTKLRRIAIVFPPRSLPRKVQLRRPTAMPRRERSVRLRVAARQSAELLEPLYQQLKGFVLCFKVVGTDDTPVKVLDRLLPHTRTGRLTTPGQSGERSSLADAPVNHPPLCSQSPAPADWPTQCSSRSAGLVCWRSGSCMRRRTAGIFDHQHLRRNRFVAFAEFFAYVTQSLLTI